jgi:hypothetical protein
MSIVIADQHTGDHCVLSGVQQVDLGNGNIEFTVQTVEQRFQTAAFLFKRGAAAQMQVEGQGSYVHINAQVK